ncbi:protein-tyrosine-phosphatase MKP1-like [Macadamia integrifolia]|uniref:protein-tyrosine-phosphatase MKP1-like n=1 Tax=Macadamia integrifolia TaxID=60698 RepID=UPI001C4E6E79|nr:protein-tyrosine-phosphatase MKP1-like [Macadamia integrifolia]
MFAWGDVKEFVPKGSLCRVYFDSMLIFDSDNRVNKFPHLSADSSSSSPHFSPSSFSSDSSNGSKSSSEFPSLSPSTSSSTASPASSSVPDLPSNTSLHPIPSISESPKVGHTSKPCFEVISSPSKRLVLSLAERRVSLSPSLKLPTLVDDKSLSYRRDTITYLTSASQQNGMGRDNNTCSSIEFCSKEKVSESIRANAIEKEDSTQECQLQMFLVSSLSNQAAGKEGTSLKKHHLLEVLDVSVFAEFMYNGSEFCNPIDPIVFCWPTLERVAPFGTANLDSEAAFLFFVPNTSVGKREGRMIYFWMGKSFKHDNCQIQLDVSSSVSDVEAIDWN